MFREEHYHMSLSNKTPPQTFSKIRSKRISKWRKQARFFNEENMKVIRNILKEEFEKKEKNIANLISANFKLTMEENKVTRQNKKSRKRNM